MDTIERERENKLKVKGARKSCRVTAFSTLLKQHLCRNRPPMASAIIATSAQYARVCVPVCVNDNGTFLLAT